MANKYSDFLMKSTKIVPVVAYFGSGNKCNNNLIIPNFEFLSLLTIFGFNFSRIIDPEMKLLSFPLLLTNHKINKIGS
jgi:hypothetical protein